MPHDDDAPILEVLDLYVRGELAEPIAAMRLALLTADGPGLKRALRLGRSRWGEAALAPLARRLQPGAADTVRRVAGAIDHRFADAEPRAVVAHLAESFDRAARLSPDAAVALYSLGDGALLQEITAEVTAWLRGSDLVRPGTRVLEVGCGAGRFLQALASEGGLLLGVEISQAMAATAVRRLGGRAGAGVVRGSGLDLRFVATGAFDLVLYADSFPYLVQAGEALVRAMLAETRRVLRPDGRAAVLNWSYRGDAALDAEEARALGAAVGLRLLSTPSPRFRGWDAQAFVLAAV